MKTGPVAKRFDVDPNTIADWTRRFEEFFSPEALALGSTQRDYQPEDILILNTIRVERVKNTPWDEIRTVLASGHREGNLPPEFTSIDGAKAVTVYAELREITAKLEIANQEIERLRAESQAKDERLIQLSEQVGKWKGLAEIYKEMLKDKDDE